MCPHGFSLFHLLVDTVAALSLLDASAWIYAKAAIAPLLRSGVRGGRKRN